MSRFKLTIEYDGSPYHGWQFQKNKPTVMGVLMNACKTAFGVSAFELYGAGRTDAGVHALAQVAHLDVHTRLQPEVLCMRLNDALPATVNILSAAPAASNFHARYDALARSYVYHVATRRTAFAKKYAYWVKDASISRQWSGPAICLRECMISNRSASRRTKSSQPVYRFIWLRFRKKGLPSSSRSWARTSCGKWCGAWQGF